MRRQRADRLLTASLRSDVLEKRGVVTLCVFVNTSSLSSREERHDNQLNVAHDCRLGNLVANDKFVEMLLEHISILRPPRRCAAVRFALGFVQCESYFAVSTTMFRGFFCFFGTQTGMKTNNVH